MTTAPMRSQAYLAGFLLVAAAVVNLPASASAADSGKKKAIAASILARSALDEGQFRKCADLYCEAWQHDPQTLGYLYSVARCEHKGGRFDAAVRDYEALIKHVGDKPNPMADKSRKFLTEARAQLAAQKKREAEVLQEARKQAEADKQKALEAEKAKAKEAPKTPQAAPVVAAPMQDTGTLQRSLGWVAVGAGVILGGTAATLYGLAVSDRQALNKQLADPDTGKQGSISHKKAAALKEEIETQKTISAIVAATGVIALGGGAFLLYSAPESTAWTPLIAPTGDGALVGATLRF